MQYALSRGESGAFHTSHPAVHNARDRQEAGLVVLADGGDDVSVELGEGRHGGGMSERREGGSRK